MTLWFTYPNSCIYMDTVSFHSWNLIYPWQPKLYVCRNLCQDSIVGNRELPLLRLVNLKKAGNIIYNYPYQVPLRFGEFQDVRVYIRNASNQPVSFLKGLTTVTLLLNKLCLKKEMGSTYV